MADAPLHSGHRERVKEKYLRDGLDGFDDHQLLELLLFYAVPRKDTNELAHRLMNSFGSLSAVFDAPIDLLTECGLSKNAAVLIKLLPDTASRYLRDKHRDPTKTINASNAGERILPFFVATNEEKVLLLLMDAKGKEMFCGIINEGSISASEVNNRKVVQLAVKYNAEYAIIAHNHPSGFAVPSDTDIQITKAIRDTLCSIGVKLIDHFIIADMEYYSMLRDKELKEIFKDK